MASILLAVIVIVSDDISLSASVWGVRYMGA